MKRVRAGFALPTILIASVVMMIVLMTALVAGSNIKSSLDTQFYDNLAREAAESGVAVAKNCQDNNQELINDTSISPDENCDGTVISGASAHILSRSDYRSTFNVVATETPDNNQQVVSTGIVELLRKSDGAVWKRFTKDLKINLYAAEVPGAIKTVSSGTSRACFVGTDGSTYCIRGGTSTIEKISDLPANVKAVGVAPDSMLVDGVKPGLAPDPPNYLLHRDPFFCMVLVNEEVYCRGTGTRPWPMSSNETMPFNDSNSVKVNLPTGVVVQEMFFSPSRVCFLDTVGDLYCLGRGTSTTPTKISLPAKVSTVVMSPSPTVQFFVDGVSSNQSAYYGNHWHTCALLVNGTVSCWNSGKVVSNRDYEMPFTTSPSSLSIPGGSTIKQMSSGTSHACFTATTSNANGNVYCVGAFTDRTLAQKSLPQPAKSVEVSPNGMYSSRTGTGILNRSYYVCANLENDDIYCWGSGTQNLAASPSDTMPFNNTTPTKVTFPAGVVIEQMKLGAAQACFMSTAKDVYCIGRGTSLSAAKVTLPQPAAALVVSPSSGFQSTQSYLGRAFHVCVLLTSGQVSCWNSGKYVYNRDYEMPFTTTPQVIGFPSGVQIEVPGGASGGGSTNTRSDIY